MCHMFNMFFFTACVALQVLAKKNILKSNDFGVMQTVFFAFTCKFGLCLHVEKVVICINKTNWHPLVSVHESTQMAK